ncbi:unnamed protein product [Blepharisma stoltei]|uniref:Uncharacterized protein n=1 Tax=Blepharisma stoltei TaxID=1481888 RepID=A0AAU9KP40_9CILI|nr:unnamed protein product [Blepharisma stoltei]
MKRLILSSSGNLSESKFGFTLNLSSYEIISNLWGVYLILEYPEAPPTLILPENQLSKYDFESIKKLIGIWKQWSIDYIVIPGGGIFEAIVSSNLHEFPLLQTVFRNYLRVLYENCAPAFQEPEKMWREFLVNLLLGTPKSIQVDLEDGSATLEYNPKTVESLNLKITNFRLLIEMWIQLARIDIILEDNNKK